MSIDRNDPRLTAYALGELDDAAFAAEVENDPAARAEVEAIRALAQRVGAELRQEDAPALTEAQRSVVAAAAGQASTRKRGRVWWIAGPLAACVVAAVAGIVHLATRESTVIEGPSEARHFDYDLRTGKLDADNSDGPSEKQVRIEAYNRDVSEKQSQLDQTCADRDQVLDQVNTLAPSKDSTESALRVKTEDAKPGSAPEAVLVLGAAAGGKPAANPAAEALDTLGEANARRMFEYGRDPGDREAYDRIHENPFVRVADEHTSTFSIDVDTASYANVRRFLNEGRLPPPDAVRIEELVNYFTYDYAGPAEGSHPFRAHVELAACPWNVKHRLARIAIKGREIPLKERPRTNLVFLVDVSGSMRDSNKLPLLKEGLKLLVDQLDEGDSVAIAVYAGAAGLVLEPTSGYEKERIKEALTRLNAGGSTNGGAGIQLAYDTAAGAFVKDGVNRVILCTDGDFNVGISDQGSLVRLIEERRKSGVFLSVLGFGTGNYQDARMEELSNHGNGNYAYVDTLKEAKKVLVDQMSGTLVTIAKDVKIQVFFNPKRVAGYRLIGYENRMLANQDFNDDTKDAGEIGAGHTVTALYELIPAGSELPGAQVDPNPFVSNPKAEPSPLAADSEALFRLRLRYKLPDGDTSTLLEEDVRDNTRGFDDGSADFQWAAAVAGFGMLLRESPYMEGTNWAAVLEIAKGARGADKEGYRAEFIELAERARQLAEGR